VGTPVHQQRKKELEIQVSKGKKAFVGQGIEEKKIASGRSKKLQENII